VYKSLVHASYRLKLRYVKRIYICIHEDIVISIYFVANNINFESYIPGLQEDDAYGRVNFPSFNTGELC